MIKNGILLLISCCTLIAPSIAQPILTKAEAIKTTLENNYDIKVAKNNIEISKTNTSKELNGYMPTVNTTAGANGSLGGSSQQFSNGQENVVSNAFNWGANASITANYTVVDKTRDANLEQLKEFVKLSDLQLRSTIENNLIQVFNTYYEVARLVQNANVLEKTLTVSAQRLKRAQYRFEYGQGIRLDILNAEVDIQRDSINLLNIQNQLATAKRNLNVIMGRAVNTSFQVDTLVQYDPSLSLNQLIQDAQNNNIQVELLEQNKVITNADLKIIDAGRKPVLGASAGYDYSFSDNAAGSFINQSTSRGFSGALNVSWNIFDGGQRKVRKQLTQINAQTLAVQKEQILQQIERDVTNAWESYQNALFISKVERKNLATNNLNFQRTAEQLKAGQVNSVEFRQAQLNLLNAETSYNSAKVDAKVIEIQLLQLAGKLLDTQF